MTDDELKDAMDLKRFGDRVGEMRILQEESHNARVALLDELPRLLRAKTWSLAAYWSSLFMVTPALLVTLHPVHGVWWVAVCAPYVAASMWFERASRNYKENRRRMALLNAWSDGLMWLAPPADKRGR